MDNKIKITEVFLYNKTLYNQMNKKEMVKRIKWTLSSLLIVIVCTISYILIITNDNIDKFLAILSFILLALGFIAIFIFMYHLMSLLSLFSIKVVFSDRCYAVTDKNEIITFKYARNSYYFRYDLLKNNLLDEIINLLILQNSLNKENKEMLGKIEEKKMALTDLYECLNIVNVYEIKEKEDCIEVMCDYIDLIRNTSYKKQSLTIYKYFDNWEELLNKLKVQKTI